MKKVIIKYFAEGHYTTEWLGFLRIAVGFFALLHFMAIQPDFYLLFSYEGLVQPDILDAMHGGTVPTIVDVHEAVAKFMPTVTYNQVLQFFRFGYLLALIGLTLGLLTRASAIVALLTQLILLNSVHFYQYGADAFTTILLFYCVVFPVGKVLSLDNRIFRKNKNVTIDTATICLRVLQVHLCVVYFIGGLDKVLGFNWRNGEAFWRAVTSHNLLNIVDLSGLKNTPFFLLGGWATILIELLYPVCIHIQRIRKLWLGLTIGMHLGIILLLGLSFFGTLMILFNLAAFYVPYLKRQVAPKKQQDMPTAVQAVLAAG
jgi:Vitamin K-dependent gamma-carboxylase